MGIDRPGGVGSLGEVRWATCCPGPPIWAPASENHQMTSQRGPNASQHQISTDSVMTRELSDGPNNRRESDAVPRRPAAGKRAGVVHGCMGSSWGMCRVCVSIFFAGSELASISELTSAVVYCRSVPHPVRCDGGWRRPRIHTTETLCA